MADRRGVQDLSLHPPLDSFLTMLHDIMLGRLAEKENSMRSVHWTSHRKILKFGVPKSPFQCILSNHGDNFSRRNALLLKINVQYKYKIKDYLRKVVDTCTGNIIIYLLRLFVT